jgi:hypothetical protein
MYMQRKKPMLLRWTQAWRRNHKKLNIETGQKRKARKIVRTVARNFVGMTSDEVRAARGTDGGGGGATATATRLARVLAAGLAGLHGDRAAPGRAHTPRRLAFLHLRHLPAAQGQDQEGGGAQARGGGGGRCREGQACAARRG